MIAFLLWNWAFVETNSTKAHILGIFVDSNQQKPNFGAFVDFNWGFLLIPVNKSPHFTNPNPNPNPVQQKAQMKSTKAPTLGAFADFTWDFCCFESTKAHFPSPNPNPNPAQQKPHSIQQKSHLEGFLLISFGAFVDLYQQKPISLTLTLTLTLLNKSPIPFNKSPILRDFCWFHLGLLLICINKSPFP